ncbi:hypothetical protein E1262_14470 [Jiangella aurantiaca]|uniref:Uncharacterized protein n=1 Tax=Jiangella aurantiaca TaxID=2530373 RepID=A0A4R5A9Z9_9ACTN|nr:hypothetical protein [Jiangella aurantiaca]TDD68941.1 hypothetical protein E1262_14470 [Jiangella aurantiaca]
MTESVDRPELEREVREELGLVESSHPEDVMGQPVAQWRFDPSDAEEYETVLKGVLAAAENADAAGEQPPGA